MWEDFPTNSKTIIIDGVSEPFIKTKIICRHLKYLGTEHLKVK